MYHIYLIVGSTYATVVVARNAKNIDLEKLAETLGGPLEIYEVGLASPQTPPGPLLVGKREDITRYRPIGKRLDDPDTESV